MIQKVNSLSSNVYTSHGEILKNFLFFFKYVELPKKGYLGLYSNKNLLHECQGKFMLCPFYIERVCQYIAS